MEGLLGPPGAETIGHIRRLVGMYIEEIVRLRESDVDDETKAKFEAVYHVFNLAMILYLPQDGRGEGLLGEELLDWVNDVDPGKSDLNCCASSLADQVQHPTIPRETRLCKRKKHGTTPHSGHTSLAASYAASTYPPPHSSALCLIIHISQYKSSLRSYTIIYLSFPDLTKRPNSHSRTNLYKRTDRG